MGHERIGFLPKSKQWQMIIKALQEYDGNPEDVKKIVDITIDNIRNQYKNIASNEVLRTAIRFLSLLCFSAKSSNQIEYLNEKGIYVGKQLNLLSLLNCVKQFVTTSMSLDEIKIAQDAVMQSLITYNQTHESSQLQFDGFDSRGIWSSVGSGSAFCEMARSFIAAFVDRHLRYYLERVAATSLSDYSQIISFKKELAKQTNAIGKHSSEISKLMQSYAAGWFNKKTMILSLLKAKYHFFCRRHSEKSEKSSEGKL